MVEATLTGNLANLWAHQPSGIPVIITGAAQAAFMAGCTLSAMRSDGSLMARIQGEFQARTGMDWTVVYADAMAVPEAMGVKVKMSPFGPVGDTVFDLNDFKGFGNVSWENTASVNAMMEALSILRQPAGQALGVLFEGPFTTAMRVFEAERMLRQIFLNPSRLEDIIREITGILKSLAEEAYRCGARIFYLPEPFVSADMLAARHSRSFAFPFITSLVEHVHGLGGRVILHICGSTEKIWPEMRDTGADALSLDQKVSLKDARSSVGPAVVLAGNVDPVRTLLQGDRVAVESETNACILAGGPANFILMPGCGVPPGTGPANLKTMVETVRNFGGSGATTR